MTGIMASLNKDQPPDKKATELATLKDLMPSNSE